MKNKTSDYINLSRIEFMVTYQCTGKCKHCSVAHKLERAGTPRCVNPHKAAEAVERLSGSYEIQSVMTFGGEPLLYPDVVCAIHEKAAARGVGTRQIITNGYFTKDESRRRDIARRLARAGVNDLLLSVDAFHQETLPVGAVYAFARELLDAGVPNIRLHPAWVVSADSDNCYNEETRRVLAVFADLEIPVSKGNNIIMSGNAVRYLSGFYEKPQLDLSETCGAMPYTEPLTDITCLSIEPNGEVTICDFVIGNINELEITDIITRYDPYGNEHMHALLKGGAAGLIEYAESLGVAVEPSDYYSVCDLCRAVSAYGRKPAE